MVLSEVGSMDTLDGRWTIPPVGTWVRARLLPHPQRGGPGMRPESPEWRSAWHLSTGDVSYRPWPKYPQFARLEVTARCGRVIALDGFDYWGYKYADAVTCDERPAVDECRTCLHVVVRL